MGSDARQRLLDVAEKMFMESGYRGVRLRDIGDALGIRTASLYYHAPGGKEDLYLAVLERTLDRHRKALTKLISGVGSGRRERLRAVAEWLCSQPRMNITRIADELRWLEPEAQKRVRELSFVSILLPLRGLFVSDLVDGQDEGGATLTASLFLSAIDAVRSAAEAELLSTPVEDAVERAVSLFDNP